MKRKANSKGAGSRSQSLTKSNTARKSGALSKTNPKGRRRRRNPASGFGGRVRNGLSRFTQIGGVSVIDIGVAGVAGLVVQGVTPILPGAPGSWVKILSQAGVVLGLVYVAPRNFKTPVAIGGGSVPAIAALNKVTNNVVPNFIAQTAGYFQPALPTGGDAGMSGFRGAGRPGYRTA